MTELKVLTDGLRSAPRGVGPAGTPCEHPHACCWESPGRIWWGPQRLQVWALGLQAAVGCLQPPCTTGSFHSWESARAGGELQRWGEGIHLSLLWGPQVLFRNPAFVWGLSCGETGSALEGGGSSDRIVGPRCRNRGCEVCPASFHLSAKCVLSSLDFLLPSEYSPFFLVTGS